MRVLLTGYVSRRGRDTVDLLVHRLELKFKQFSPDNPVLGGPSVLPISGYVAHELDAIEPGEGSSEAVAGGAIRNVGQSRTRGICREIQGTESMFPVHADL
jgi:hypothetical protein